MSSHSWTLQSRVVRRVNSPLASINRVSRRVRYPFDCTISCDQTCNKSLTSLHCKATCHLYSINRVYRRVTAHFASMNRVSRGVTCHLLLFTVLNFCIKYNKNKIHPPLPFFVGFGDKTKHKLLSHSLYVIIDTSHYYSAGMLIVTCTLTTNFKPYNTTPTHPRFIPLLSL